MRHEKDIFELAGSYLNFGKKRKKSLLGESKLSFLNKSRQENFFNHNKKNKKNKISKTEIKHEKLGKTQVKRKKKIKSKKFQKKRYTRSSIDNNIIKTQRVKEDLLNYIKSRKSHQQKASIFKNKKTSSKNKKKSRMDINFGWSTLDQNSITKGTTVKPQISANILQKKREKLSYSQKNKSKRPKNLLYKAQNSKSPRKSIQKRKSSRKHSKKKNKLNFKRRSNSSVNESQTRTMHIAKGMAY